MNPSEGKKYKAFVSYSCMDKKAARWLYKKLRNTKLPKGALHKSSKKQPLGEIFFDRSRLHSGSKLQSDIQKALDQSEHLIVMCTPESARSFWVRWESEYFYKIKNGENIHWVVLKGDPKKKLCMPPFFRCKVNFETETAYADFRTIKTRKDAWYSLLSGLSGVKAKYLKREDQKRKRRWLGFGVFIFIIVLGIIALLAVEVAIAEASARRTELRSFATQAADRGDWKGALSNLDKLLSERPLNMKELRVERLRGYFALGDRETLDQELKKLETLELSGHLGATVKLHRGDFLMARMDKRDEAIDLIKEALASGLLKPADAAYAKGLIEPYAEKAIENFQEAVELNGFHHRANSLLAITLTFMGRLEEATSQCDFFRRTFPDDPAAHYFNAWLGLWNQDDEAVRDNLYRLKDRLGATPEEQEANYERLLDSFLSQRTLHSLVGKFALAGRDAAPGDILQLMTEVVKVADLGGERAPDLALFGLSLPSLPWYSEGFEKAVYAVPKVIFNKKKALKQVEEAAAYFPEGTTLMFHAFLNILANTKMAQDGREKQFMEVVKESRDLLEKSASTRSMAPDVQLAAKVYLLGLDAYLAELDYPKSEDDKIRKQGIRRLLFDILSDERFDENMAQSLLPVLKALPDFDPDLLKLVQYEATRTEVLKLEGDE